MDIATNTKCRIIITGSTGMVGEGVLHECLLNSNIDEILVINRKPCGIQHPKLKEIMHSDFYNLSAIEKKLKNYNACLFCLGVSSIGKNETDYYQLTYTLTLNFANTLCNINTNMTFCYISGAATDSTESGKLMWARVKGKTENDLKKLAFKNVYNFRPGILQPTKGLKNTLSYYKYIGWLLPIIQFIAPKIICKLSELGKAMINSVLIGYKKQTIEVSDIIILSKK